MLAMLSIWAGTWWQTAAPPAGDAIKDANGVVITVGATVKLVGVVTAINTGDPHFGTIQITPSHPPTGASRPPQAGNPGAPVTVYKFAPLQLVVGS